MSGENCDTLYPDFNACFHASADFPDQAKESIPGELISVIDAGNTEFFSDLSLAFPKLFRTLVSDCTRICLLEHLSIGMSLDDIGQEYRTYCWGLKCGEQLVTARIPVSAPSSEISKQNSVPYLNCIPEALSAFYAKMDGIAIAEGIGPNGFDLPAGFGDWRELRRFMEDSNRSSDIADGMYRDFQDADLRVFIQCSNDELVICDLSGKSKELYLLSAGDRNYQKILRPIDVLDTFFANVIKGKSSVLSQMI